MEKVKNVTELPIMITKIKGVLRMCTTLSKARDAFYNTPNGSEAEKKALEFWLSLCKNAVEAREVCYLAPWGSEIRAKAFKKWEILSLAEVDNAKTPEEALIAYTNAPPYSRAKEKALEKLKKMSPKRSITITAGIQEIYYCVPEDYDKWRQIF